MLVGSVTYTGEATAITVWGDDMTTDEVEGLLDGEEISFELWRKSEDKVEELKIHNWLEGNNVYSVNGIAIVAHGASSPTAVYNGIKTISWLSKKDYINQLKKELEEVRGSVNNE